MRVGHVRHALQIQVLNKGFYGTTERVLPMPDAVVFQPPQHAVTLGCPSAIHGRCGQGRHGGARACEPGVVWEIETMAPGVERWRMHAILSPCTFRTSPRLA
jgi:hypothetical protein